MNFVVDYSHTHRSVTGIERISIEQFSETLFAGRDVKYIKARNVLEMIVRQWISLPFHAATRPEDVFFCPGFPPSILLSLLGRERVIPYIHDVFLLTRHNDLNLKAKLYMKPSFSAAVSRLPRFFVNSVYTRDELEKFCRSDARILLLRPYVSNVFGLQESPRPDSNLDPIKIVSIGTIEPRKNYRAAAKIRENLELILERPVELHIIGRIGWGQDADYLRKQTRVFVRGYCTAEETRSTIQSSHIFLTTSKEEGLGLPLLEVQYAGMLVVASDIPVFREVLGDSGCLIPPDDTKEAAQRIAAIWRDRQELALYASRAMKNVREWNDRAQADRDALIQCVQSGSSFFTCFDKAVEAAKICSQK